MARSNSLDEMVFRLNHLNERDRMDEDTLSLGDAYDNLLDAYQEARELNYELEEMIQEYIRVYGAL